MERKTHIIGAASGWGAQVPTCEDGPDALKEAGTLASLKDAGVSIEAWDTLYPQVKFKEGSLPLPERLPIIAELSARLAGKVSKTLQEGEFPVVLCGDHANAVGTWNGVGRECEPLGLIWIDAHMDSHTPETTPSGAWHGMPLAALLGYGAPALAQLTRENPILRPEHLCLIGIRSFEEGEAALLKLLQVKIYFIDEVQRRGLKTVLAEAIGYVKQAAGGFGVSLDVDSVDPSEAPGVGTPEENGLSADELLGALTLLQDEERLQAFELVEFNPHLDKNRATLKLCQRILETVLRERKHG